MVISLPSSYSDKKPHTSAALWRQRLVILTHINLKYVPGLSTKNNCKNVFSAFSFLVLLDVAHQRQTGNMGREVFCSLLHFNTDNVFASLHPTDPHGDIMSTDVNNTSLNMNIFQRHGLYRVLGMLLLCRTGFAVKTLNITVPKNKLARLCNRLDI